MRLTGCEFVVCVLRERLKAILDHARVDMTLIIPPHDEESRFAACLPASWSLETRGINL